MRDAIILILLWGGNINHSIAFRGDIIQSHILRGKPRAFRQGFFDKLRRTVTVKGRCWNPHSPCWGLFTSNCKGHWLFDLVDEGDGGFGSCDGGAGSVGCGAAGGSVYRRRWSCSSFGFVNHGLLRPFVPSTLLNCQGRGSEGCEGRETDGGFPCSPPFSWLLRPCEYCVADAEVVSEWCLEHGRWWLSHSTTSSVVEIKDRHGFSTRLYVCQKNGFHGHVVGIVVTTRFWTGNRFLALRPLCCEVLGWVGVLVGMRWVNSIGWYGNFHRRKDCSRK